MHPRGPSSDPPRPDPTRDVLGVLCGVASVLTAVGVARLIGRHPGPPELAAAALAVCLNAALAVILAFGW
jgi:hypothetical protein